MDKCRNWAQPDDIGRLPVSLVASRPGERKEKEKNLEHLAFQGPLFEIVVSGTEVVAAPEAMTVVILCHAVGLMYLCAAGAVS